VHSFGSFLVEHTTLYQLLDGETKAQLCQSPLVDRMKKIRSSRASTEMLSLMESAMSNLKVSQWEG